LKMIKLILLKLNARLSLKMLTKKWSILKEILIMPNLWLNKLKKP
jgi:hypothetical protein